MKAEGGCLCGAVRYRFDAEPFGAGYCHCSMCRKSSGAPVIAAASVPRGALVIEGEAALRRYGSSAEVTRVFCGTCGGQLFFEIADEPDSIDFWIGSLDHPDAVPPTFHIYAADRVKWLDLHDDLPRYAAGRKGQIPMPS